MHMLHSPIKFRRLLECRSDLYKIIAVYILSIVFIVCAAHGLRGSDQYWYVSDVETLTTGEEPTTNHYFAGPLLRSQVKSFTEAPANYFLHNGPILAFVKRINTLPGAATSAYQGWIFLNLLCHLIVALSLYSICRKLAIYPLEITSLYLLSPIAIWQSSNILAEVFLSSLLAVIVACFVQLHFRVPPETGVVPDQKSNRLWPVSVLILAVCFATGVLSHPLFLILACFYFIFLIYGAFHSKLSLVSSSHSVSWFKEHFLVQIVAAVLFIIVVFVLSTQTKKWFPTMYQGSILEFKVRALPHVSSMLLYQSFELQTLNLQIVLQKMLFAVKTHFLAVSLAPFTAITNLGLLSYLFLCLTRFRKYSLLLLTFGVIYTTYAAMLVLHTFRFGYVQIIAIVSFVTIAIFVKEFRLKKIFARFAIIAALGLCIALNLYLVVKSRSDSDLDASRHQQYVELFQDISESAKVMIIHPAKNKQIIPYALRPRKVLEVNLQLIESESIERLIELFQPDYILSDNDPNLPGVGSFQKLYQVEEGKFGKMALYRI